MQESQKISPGSEYEVLKKTMEGWSDVLCKWSIEKGNSEIRETRFHLWGWRKRETYSERDIYACSNINVLFFLTDKWLHDPFSIQLERAIWGGRGDCGKEGASRVACWQLDGSGISQGYEICLPNLLNWKSYLSRDL